MPTTFTRTGPDGATKTRVAYSPADEVQLRFEGWTEKTDGAAKTEAPARPVRVFADGTTQPIEDETDAKASRAEPAKTKASSK